MRYPVLTHYYYYYYYYYYYSYYFRSAMAELAEIDWKHYEQPYTDTNEYSIFLGIFGVVIAISLCGTLIPYKTFLYCLVCQ